MSVYFITAREVDLVKIGCAHNPVARFNHLRTSSPIELALEGAIVGSYHKERELHQRYAKWRVRGEWFTITPSIEEEIEAATLPRKFTWAAVRVWLDGLAKESAEHEASCTARAEVIRRVEEELQERLDTAARRSRMTPLQRLEADGIIHFPFRAEAVA